MMRRSQRLKGVQQVAQRKEDQAADQFGVANRLLNDRQVKLVELQGYLVEYQQDLVTRGGRGVTAQQLRQLQRFLAQIEQAIVQQKQLVQAAETQRERQRKVWLEARAKREAMDRVIANALEQENFEVMRQEQKESDERGQRRREGVGFE
ncbi:MAG: flagellar export protein FliJ [Gammaproteobacteria bacterium]|nr:flagellar export protein FliJ [Gammaproteobacteria bacterium]